MWWIKQSLRAAQVLRTLGRGISPPQNIWVERIWMLTVLTVAREEELMHTWGAALGSPQTEQVTDVKLFRSHLLQTPPMPRVLLLPAQNQGSRVH